VLVFLVSVLLMNNYEFSVGVEPVEVLLHVRIFYGIAVVGISTCIAMTYEY